MVKLFNFLPWYLRWTPPTVHSDFELGLKLSSWFLTFDGLFGAQKGGAAFWSRPFHTLNWNCVKAGENFGLLLFGNGLLFTTFIVYHVFIHVVCRASIFLIQDFFKELYPLKVVELVNDKCVRVLDLNHMEYAEITLGFFRIQSSSSAADAVAKDLIELLYILVNHF